MKTRLLAVVTGLLVVSSCSAKEDTAAAATKPTAAGESKVDTKDGLLERARQRSGNKEPSVLDVWNEIVRGAEEKAGAIKNVGKPRVVPKGAKPEVIVNYDGLITFNGQPLRLGDHIDTWRAVLPKDAVCHDSVVWQGKPKSTGCFWDDLGMFISTTYANPGAVVQLKIVFNFELLESSLQLPPLDGESKSMPNHAFRGYFEIDGCGVDKDTKFWEMRSGVDGRRSLRCGLTDCSHPHGGGGNHTISIRVDGKSEYDRLRTITLGGSQLTN
jgi:hypothetical protein